MSVISRSSVLSAAAGLALAWSTLAPASVPAAPPLPAAAAALVPDARLQGGGELAWYGLPVYDGWLWSARGAFAFDAAFALDLRYRRALVGRRIAERSVEEMARQGSVPADDLARWREAMAGLFPDVAKGDRIVGVHVPGRGAAFFHNGRLLGEIDDVRFARAFFGIWLDPRTSRPDFRRQLLGEP
jgi:hypothetical protein